MDIIKKIRMRKFQRDLERERTVVREESTAEKRAHDLVLARVRHAQAALDCLDVSNPSAELAAAVIAEAQAAQRALDESNARNQSDVADGYDLTKRTARTV
jgi:hypothetical protein